MKSITLTLIVLIMLCCLVNTLHAQNSVGIGTENSNNNAVLELVSPGNNQGFLVPRLTTTQRTASSFTNGLSPSENGLMVFDSDEKKFYYWHDNQWQPIKNGPDLVAGAGISIAGSVIINTGDADADPLNEIQDLNLTGNTLTITNNTSATPIDLASFSGDNTDNQTLSFSGALLSITGGNSVTLTDVDPTNELQTLSLGSNNFTLSNGGGTIPLFSGSFTDLSNIPVNLDTDASDDFDGNWTSLNGVPAGFADGTDDDTTYGAGTGINVSGGIITNTGDTDASDDFDGAWGSLSGIPAEIADGDDVNDADNSTSNELQNLSLSGDIVSISGSTADIDLSPYRDNTDDQSLSLSSNTLTLTSASSGGSTVDLSGYLDNTDAQNLSSSISGTNRTIDISGGTGTTINVADNDNNSTNEFQALTKNGNEISLSNGGGTVSILQPSAFRTGLTKDQGLNSTATLIVFEVEDYDLNGDFDGSSTFVAPVNGIFNFSGLISILVDTGVDGQLSFRVEGSVAHAIYLTSSTNNSSHPFSVDLSLTAGDRVQLAISSNNGGNMLGSFTQTNWSGRLVMETTK